MLATVDKRYEFHDEIGQGGMAVVYRGFDTKLRRDVAIKVLRPDVTANENVVRAFHSEAAATSTLSHPNIVNLYDFGELTDGRLFMVIELLHGSSLARILDEHRDGKLVMSWPRIVGIATQVCAALSAAHANGIVHHDITPGNIFCLSGQGIRGDHVKVLDFGIAKITEMTKAVTVATLGGAKTGQDIKGTPYYIAPEIVMSRPADHRVDIYGLGAVMYELCTGMKPFNQQNLYALLMQVASAALIPPTEANPDCGLSPEAEATVLAAMDRDPDGRPQTALELAHRLEASLHAAPTLDASPRRSQSSLPAANIGLDLTLPHSGPLPELVLAVSQPLPTIPPPQPQPLATGPHPVVTGPQRVVTGSAPRVVAAPSEPGSETAMEPSTTSATRPAGKLWPFVGIGLGLGLAGLIGFLVSELRQSPTPTTPQEARPTPVVPSREPDGATNPAPEKPSAAQIEADRLATLETRMRGARQAQLACLEKTSIMRGLEYKLPVKVAIAADGRATATFDDTSDITEDLLPAKGRACILGLVHGEPFPAAALAVQVPFVITVEE